MTLRFLQADSEESWREARRLVEDYACSLNLDLCFQNFEDELADLAGEYGPPGGGFFLAEEEGVNVGCVGLRRFSDTTGEIKRLYVVPGARGSGVGRKLAEAVIALARKCGYRRIVLDTLPSMNEALALYASLGFRAIPAYRFNPVEGAVFLELVMNEAKFV
jgi:putative acetyltransferase